jgi:hypothetical protein
MRTQVVVVVIAVLPFLAVAGLLWMSAVLRGVRAESIARQIALTDAIHRELGAAAAPEVRWSWGRGWIVSMRLPLRSEGTVGAVSRITHDVFRGLDRPDAMRLSLVLLAQEPRRGMQARPTGLGGPAARLRPAA